MTTPTWNTRYRTTDTTRPARAALIAYADRYGHTERVHALVDAHAAEVLTAAARPDEAALHQLAADIHTREHDFYQQRLSTYELEAEVTRLTAENQRLRDSLAKAGRQ